MKVIGFNIQQLTTYHYSALYVRIRSAYRKGFILYIEAIDRNQDVKSPEYLVVKDGLESCTFIGREFLQQVAVAAGAGSENGLDMRHDFFITKTPIRMRR